MTGEYDRDEHDPNSTVFEGFATIEENRAAVEVVPRFATRHNAPTLHHKQGKIGGILGCGEHTRV